MMNFKCISKILLVMTMLTLISTPSHAQDGLLRDLIQIDANNLKDLEILFPLDN